ncbi:MAG: glucose-1-phosphate adenylyltransferase [Armatimonadetes bacterium]|nr:glucose-1-phosphate adenylyltransferase [Armatimonadota bacterium]
MPENVVCAILGGGRGTRLFPLTKERCKPAVPLFGKYRLIDVPVSNCLNSGYGRIFVLTQFNTASLHRHISRTYSFDALSERFVEILAAEQTLERGDWYQGTADAIRQNLRHLRLDEVDYVLVLSGDHLYRMDYREMVRHHQEAGACITIAAKPVTSSEVSSLGILRADVEDVVVAFAEKPKDQQTVDAFALPRPAGICPVTGEPLTHLASMGVYVFSAGVLKELLQQTDFEDFGSELIPYAISRCRVAAFRFSGYWEDIGTISTFYRANLEMTDPLPRMNLYDENWPLYTRPRYLPPAKIASAHVERSLVADGSIVEKSEVFHSIVGLRSVISEGCRISDSVLMGHDFYDGPRGGLPPLGIGPGCQISGAIVDKNTRLGESTVIRGRPGCGLDLDEALYHVRDGIVVVPRGVVLPPGTHIVV